MRVRLLVLSLACLCAAGSSAAVPPLMNYQGMLASLTDVPVDTTLSITFRLYDASAAGATLLWSENHATVTVTKGLFDVILGASAALPDSIFNRSEVWMGVVPGNDSELSPRTRLVSAGYAFRVGTVDGASGGVIQGDLATTGKVTAGTGNTNSGARSLVAGETNSVSGDRSSITGGSGNTVSSNESVVCGGSDNHSQGLRSGVCCGQSNHVSGQSSFVGGGFFNQATGSSSFIGGGWMNEADGEAAMIPGGYYCQATGSHSFAAGTRAVSQGSGCFTWADGNSPNIWNTIDNSFVVRSSGGVFMYTNPNATVGAELYSNSSAWSTVSDSTKKRNARVVNTADILERVIRLPIKQWSYKEADPSIEHVGPMAQDFWGLFHLGEDSLAISTTDPAGIALAAIQELNNKAERVDELEKEVRELRTMVMDLRRGSQAKGN
jgi:hypothetical protein